MSDAQKVWYAPYKNQAYGKDEIQAVVECLNDGWLAPGPRTDEFQRQVAKRFGKKYGLFVNSGSSANMIAYICAGVDKGVEVVTPACTFSTTISPLVQLGAKVVFCDIYRNRYVPSVDQVINEVSQKTKVIAIPNLLGNKIDWSELKRRLLEIGRSDIVLVEDSCDTITFTPESDISTNSFYASHIITAGGTGGMVMFNSINQFNRALRIRDWGRVGGNDEEVAGRFNHGLLGDIQYDWKFIYCEYGFNMKSSEMNAAFGLVQMKKLPQFEKLRNEYLHRYINGIKADPVAANYYAFPDFKEGVLFLALPLACPDRMEIIEFLEKNQVQTRVTMAGNILRHPLYQSTFPDQALRSFPECDRVMREGFLVGCHHGMSFEDVDRVVSLLIQFAKMKSKN